MATRKSTRSKAAGHFESESHEHAEQAAARRTMTRGRTSLSDVLLVVCFAIGTLCFVLAVEALFNP
jgi:hypothetical protein